MEEPNPRLLQDLKYGIIYVYGNPKQIGHLRWFATMVEPMMRPLTLEWRQTTRIDYTLIVARRFNVGNLGKYATCQLRLADTSNSFSLLAAVHTFSDCLEDITDTSEGDVVINERDYNDRNAMPSGRWGHSMMSEPLFEPLRRMRGIMEDMDAPQDHTRVEMPPQVELDYDAACRQLEKCQQDEARPSFSSNEDWDVLGDEASDAEVDRWDESITFMRDIPELDQIMEEQQEERVIEQERTDVLNNIKAQILKYITQYHDDPKQLMNQLFEGKVILNDDGSPGRLLVNGDMRIVLPDYDEMEVKMTAMCRTVYILFLMLKATGRQGIKLVNIDDYRENIANIYSLVKPLASDDRVRRSIDNLCDPLSNTLNVTISKINRYVKNVILDERLARQYMITGNKGECYSVALEPSMITLPNAVTMG